MNNLFFIFLVLLFFSCSKKSIIYNKYVYVTPTLGAPYKAVTEVDIWFSRLMYRNLVKVDIDGFLSNDLAESIESTDHKEFIIKLKKNIFFQSGRPINGQRVKECLEKTLSNTKSSLIHRISSIEVNKEGSLLIDLHEATPDFVKHLSSHIFSIYNPLNMADVSGRYYKTSNLKLKKRDENSSYPNEVKIIKSNKSEVLIDSGHPFDTFLAYTTPFKNTKMEIKYRVQDTWGLIVNLKGKFSDLSQREKLSQSINRKQLTSEIFSDHTPVWSLNGNLNSIHKNTKKLNFNILIPNEISSTGKKFCGFLKQIHEVKCYFTDFIELLKRLKENKFDSALISLTTDFPYIESNLDYLDPNSRFSIVNTKISIPRNLKRLYGSKFFNAFEKFVFQNQLFISLSLPVRTVYASKKENYTPSLIGPAFDPIENLIR
jgi:hypothetical protein